MNRGGIVEICEMKSVEGENRKELKREWRGGKNIKSRERERERNK